jgi:hypothetical protein
VPQFWNGTQAGSTGVSPAVSKSWNLECASFGVYPRRLQAQGDTFTTDMAEQHTARDEVNHLSNLAGRTGELLLGRLKQGFEKYPGKLASPLRSSGQFAIIQ